MHCTRAVSQSVPVRLAALLALVLSAFTTAGCASAVPLAIRDEMATTARVQPGATTVVFFTDFQCPFCRRTHAELAPLLAARRGRVRLVVHHVPLARHPDARTAARAAVCFESIVASRATRTDVLFEEYVQVLMASSDLSEATCERLAEEHGVAREAMQRCLSEPSTEVRIEQDLALFDAVQGDGVPLIFIGRVRLEGAQSRSSLEAALDAADGH